MVGYKVTAAEQCLKSKMLLQREREKRLEGNASKRPEIEPGG